MDPTYTGDQIAQRRKALGLTQKILAHQLHVTDKAVSKWERGLNFPDLTLMESLAQALDTTPAQLLGLESATEEELRPSMDTLSTSAAEAVYADILWARRFRILFAILLILIYNLFGSPSSREPFVYHLLIACLAVWLWHRWRTSA